MASTFLGRISPKLLRNVNLDRVVTNALRSSSRSNRHTILIACLNPSSASLINSRSSESWSGPEMPARMGIHATSNMGLTCSACDAE